MKHIFGSLLVLCLFTNTAFSGEALIFSGHPEGEPFQWGENEEMVGVAPTLLAMLFTDLGISIRSEVLPWARAVEHLTFGDIDVIPCIYFTEERSKSMNYSISYAKETVSVFVMQGKSFPFNKLEDLIGKKGGTTIGDSWGEKFDTFADEKLLIERAPKVLHNLKKMEAGRLDYIIGMKYGVLITAEKYGYKDKIKFLPNPVSSNNIYMAFSKQSRFSKFLPDINKKLNQMKEDGIIEKLIEKYIEKYIEKAALRNSE